MNDKQIKSLFNSELRIVNDLSGNWQVESNGDKYKRFVPFSDTYNDEFVITRNVVIPNDIKDNYNWQLHFEGINNQIEIFWNNQFVGRYFESHFPFDVRIPDKYISSKNNELRLVISKFDGLREKIAKTNLFALKNQVGPIRELFLVATPQIWTSEIRSNLEFSNNYTNAYLEVDFTVLSGDLKKLIQNYSNLDTNSPKTSSKKFNFNYQAQLIDKSSGSIVSTSDIGSAAIENERSINLQSKLVVSNPNLWSPTNPNLYYLKIKLTRNNIDIDEIAKEFGFKEVRLIRSGDRNQIMLNGEEFKIKGLAYVDDIVKDGQSISAYKLENDIENIKTIGTNVIRIKNSIPSEYLVHLCNVNGIMLMVELPIYDQPTKLLKEDEIQVLIKNSINSHFIPFYNSPSILAIGLGDTYLNDDIISKNLNNTIGKIKSMYKILFYQIVPLSLNKSFILNNVDFIGIRALGLDMKMDEFSKYLSNSVSKIENKPIFLDYGVLIQPENHNGYSDNLSIEYQSYIILNYNKIASANNLCGSIYNTYNDYIRESPLLITNNDDLYLNTSGIVARDRTSRFSLTALQSIYNDEKEPLLNSGSFTPYSPYTFIIYSVLLLIILFAIIKKYKRFREYMFRSLLRPYNFYSDIRDQRIISMSLTIFLGIIISINIGVYLASILYYFRNSLDFQFLIMVTLKSNLLKELLIKLIWKPDLLVLFISLISMILAFVTALLIRIFSIIKSSRINFDDSLIIVVWSALPCLILLPFSIVLYKVLIAYPFSLIFFLLLFITLIISNISRLAKSISIVFNIQIKYVSLITIGIILFFGLIFILYYQFEHSILSYFDYMMKVII